MSDAGYRARGLKLPPHELPMVHRLPIHHEIGCACHGASVDEALGRPELRVHKIPDESIVEPRKSIAEDGQRLSASHHADRRREELSSLAGTVDAPWSKRDREHSLPVLSPYPLLGGNFGHGIEVWECGIRERLIASGAIFLECDGRATRMDEALDSGLLGEREEVHRRLDIDRVHPLAERPRHKLRQLDHRGGVEDDLHSLQRIAHRSLIDEIRRHALHFGMIDGCRDAIQNAYFAAALEECANEVLP